MLLNPEAGHGNLNRKIVIGMSDSFIDKYEWYLSINEKKDNIEKILPNDIDLNGWELRKALLFK